MAAKPVAAPPVDPKKKKLQRFYKSAACAYVGGYGTFLIAQAVGTNTLLHEEGHALAARALFDHADPHMYIHPFDNGATTFTRTHLSSLGQSLGRNNSLAAVAAAGPAVDLGVTLATMAIGYKIRHKQRLLGFTLMGYASVSHLSNLLYAVSAVTSPAPGNDFSVIASSLHISPWVAVGVLAAALPLELLLLRATEKQPPKPPSSGWGSAAQQGKP